MFAATVWWIILFGADPDGTVTRLAFLRTPPDVLTYADCQAVIPTLNVALSQRGGLASCFEAPDGIDLETLLGRTIEVKSDF